MVYQCVGSRSCINWSVFYCRTDCEVYAEAGHASFVGTALNQLRSKLVIWHVLNSFRSLPYTSVPRSAHPPCTISEMNVEAPFYCYIVPLMILLEYSMIMNFPFNNHLSLPVSEAFDLLRGRHTSTHI